MRALAASLCLSLSSLLVACAEAPAPEGALASTTARASASALASASSASSASPTSSSSVSSSPNASPSASPTAATLPRDLNVLVIYIDSLRADHMPWLGYERDTMPNLAKLARESVSYTQAYALSSYTAMTFGGFVAGKYPSEVARSGTFFSAVADEVTTFPELLQKAGVSTMAGHAHWYFQKGKSGLEQGFDVWELVPGIKKSNTTDENVTSPKHLELALAQLGQAERTKGRFFGFYYFLDPHDQYMGHPEKSFGKSALDLYDGELFYTDLHLGKLLDYVDKQPWGARTAIIVTGDHGETFGEHGMYRHGHELWQELVRVPLLVKLPGAKPRVIDEPRGHVDLPPTIMELFGVPGPEGMQGKSLVGELLGGPVEPRPVVADLPRTGDSDRRRAVIVGTKKLLALGDDDAFKVFDLAADPKEKNDLAKDATVLAPLRKVYDELGRSIRDVCPKRTDKLKGKKKGRPC